MNAKKRIFSALNGGRVDRIPAWLPVVPVTVQMMEISRAPWPASHHNAEQMARLAAMPWELTGLATATVPFCLSLEAEALGCELDWGTINRTPSVKKRAFLKPDELDVPENLLEHGRIMTALEATEILQERLGEKIVINAKVTGPFTIAGHLFGVGNFLSWIKTNPELVHEAMSRTVEVTKDLAHAFLAHGADIISVSDPTSSGDLISGGYYEEFVFAHHRDVAASIRSLSTLHICGYTKELLPYIRHTGFDGFSFEEKVDVLTARKLLGDDISLIGNISPVATMLQGSVEKVEAEARACMNQGIDLLSSGCTLSPLTPIENIRALVRAAEEYQIPRGPEEQLIEFGRGLAAREAAMKIFALGFEAGRRFKDNRAVYELIERGLQDNEFAPAAKIAETLEDLLPKAEPFRAIARSVAGGEVEEAAVLVRAAVKEGWDGLIIATDGLLQGMDAVSVLYNRKQAYVPEILLAARALEAGLALCGDLRAMENKGTVLIHTADGDLHDIGKNIVAAIVAANGYRVIDLGTSVPADRVLAEVKKNRPLAVLGSSLMTSTRGAFLETADRLLQEGLKVPLIVGGGACDGAFASQRENTRYARDPAALVGVLDEIVRELKNKPGS